jgi:hypothetical protein
MERLKEVTEKICELLKDSELNPTKLTSWSGYMTIPIREAEVLMALGESKNPNFYTAIDYSGNFIENYCGEYENSPHSWTLGKPLSEQSEETIEFLHQILVR